MSGPIKKCRGCDVVKPTAEFYKERESGHYRSLCKVCYADFNRKQRVKHREKRLEYDAARGCGWGRSGRERWNPTQQEKHDSYLRRTYGISLKQYDDLFEKQNGLCAICHTTCNRSTTVRLCVDHDHETNKVRGLLCFQCNVGLGKFKEDLEILRKAMLYLKEHN